MTGLEKLQSIGAHKIFETTHIAKKFVEDILNQKFSSMNKVQFTGFISILEREYNIDLHELHEAYLKSLGLQESGTQEPFVVSKHDDEGTSTTKYAYAVVGLLVIGAFFMLFKPSSPEKTETVSLPKTLKTSPIKNELNNSTIEEAKLNLTSLDEGTDTKKVIVVEEKKIESVVEPTHTSRFVVAPRSKLWIGIVDLETYKRSQKMSSNSFELDPDKEWLLVMGHGFVNFEVNGEEKKYKDENKVWFAYENGSLSKLSRAEFKEKNRGKAW